MARRIRGIGQTMRQSADEARLWARQARVADRPFVLAAASGAGRPHLARSDLKKRPYLTFKAGVDFFPCRGADKNETFHGSLQHPQLAQDTACYETACRQFNEITVYLLKLP